MVVDVDRGPGRQLPERNEGVSCRAVSRGVGHVGAHRTFARIGAVRLTGRLPPGPPGRTARYTVHHKGWPLNFIRRPQSGNSPLTRPGTVYRTPLHSTLGGPMTVAGTSVGTGQGGVVALLEQSDLLETAVPASRRDSALKMTLLWVTFQASVSNMYTGYLARSSGLSLGKLWGRAA